MKVIISSPALDAHQNVSGVSSVTNFIILHNTTSSYIHFLQGKGDEEIDTPLYRIWRVIKNYISWKKLLKENPQYIIHYNFPLETKSIIRDYPFMHYAVKKNRGVIIHLHGGLYLFKREKPWIIQKLLKKIFSWSCPFIVLSEKEKKAVQKQYGTHNIVVLPNCVDLEDAKRFTRDDFEETTLHLLFLGRIESNKGIYFILKASEQLKRDKVDFVLHFAGKDQCNGKYINQFKESLKDHFIYEGIVSGKNKIDLLKKCKVFLLPSFYEGLPMSLLECMSFGMIPIVTDVGSIGEVVNDGENGIFVKQKDFKTIVAAIKFLVRDRKAMRLMSNSSQKTIIDKFSPLEYIKTLNKVYKTL